MLEKKLYTSINQEKKWTDFYENFENKEVLKLTISIIKF